ATCWHHESPVRPYTSVYRSEVGNQIMNPQRRKELVQKLEAQDRELAAAGAREKGTGPVPARRSALIPVLDQVPEAPDYRRHVLHHVNLDEIRSEEHTSELQSRENLVCR